MRIEYSYRAASIETWDAALVAALQALGHTVVSARDTDLPTDPAYYTANGVGLLIVGSPPSNAYTAHPAAAALAGLPVDILSFCRHTSRNALGMATSTVGTGSAGTLERLAGADARAYFASLALPSTTPHQGITTLSGGTLGQYKVEATAVHAVATRARTVGAETFESIHWSWYYWHLATPPESWPDLWELFLAFATDAPPPPREVRAALPSPLAAGAALVRTDTRGWCALASPLGQSATALGLVRRQARVALHSPLYRRPPRVAVAVGTAIRASLASPLAARAGAQAKVGPAVAAAWPSPLGRLAGLVAAAGGARVALASPLGGLRARLALPRLVPAAAAPAARPPRLLADPLPLRRGSELPSYRTDAPLPWVYGRVTLRPLPLDAAGLEWLLADHPILAVSAVRDDQGAVSGWGLEQRMDETGTPVAVLRLSRAHTGTLAVDLAGRRHAVSGALIEHPADIAADLLARCGLPAGDWSALRSAWPGVRLGGVIADAIPLREALGTVIGSVGARWSAAPLRAWVADAAPQAGALAPADIDEASASSDTGSLATRLTVPWGWDWAAGEPRGTVVVQAPESIGRYGDIAAERPAPWLRTARDALALAEAELARRARPEWTIEVQTGPLPGTDADSGRAPWRPGERLALTHPWVPTGLAEIARIATSASGHRLALIRPAGPRPRVETVRHGALVDPAASPVGIAYRDGVATFTIADESGHPLAGAAVSLDGTRTAYTDRLGRVQFRTERGVHTLTVTASGYAAMEIEVAV